MNAVLHQYNCEECGRFNRSVENRYLRVVELYCATCEEKTEHHR